MVRWVILSLIVLLTGQAQATPPPPLFPGFGVVHRSVTTSSEMAQRYFDQGLALFYAYSFAEAARSFKEATRYDPQCAICYWGEALAAMALTKKPGDEAMQEAVESILKAQNYVVNASPLEKILIQIQAERVGRQDSSSYIENMRQLHLRYPDDADIAALYVDAGLDVDLKKEPAQAKLILQTLDEGLKKHPWHVGLNHFNIHARQPLGLSKEALPSAEKLKVLIPDAGHLRHMPAHIYYDLGRYHEATEANYQGIAADNRLFKEGALKYPASAEMYAHPYFYLFGSLIMEGRETDALAAAKELRSRLETGDLPSTPVLRDKVYSVPYLILAHFGDWSMLQQAPPPPKDLPYARAMWEYAGGVAAIHSGNLARARELLGELQSAHHDDESLEALIRLAALDLEAEMALASGQRQRAIGLLKKAMSHQENVEGPSQPWYVSPSQELPKAMLAPL